MQGQHYDEESGLHYNRHRYYDPTLGRYITQDPIGLLGGWNLYRYTNNPIRFIDPLGLATICTRLLKGIEYVRPSGNSGLDLGIFHAHIFMMMEAILVMAEMGFLVNVNQRVISAVKKIMMMRK
jgi:RHS repeat-associated protein